MISIKKIALDAMSGDAHPRFFVKAACKALKKYSDIKIILVGKEKQLKSAIKNHKPFFSQDIIERLNIENADTIIGMQEKPSYALKYGQKSSMWKTIELIKDKKVNVGISSGNTGALMAIGINLLKLVNSIHRPAIFGCLPGSTKKSFMMDLGANINCSPENLYQFAILGSSFIKKKYDITFPSIGILNVGKEDIKGNQLVQKTKEMIENNPSLNFKRFIEAHELYSGVVDLIVCDGFAGNIAIKSSEGTARYIRRNLLKANSSIKNKILYWLALPWLKSRIAQIDTELYNGALFLGLNGILIKSHGAANDLHIAKAIEQAITNM